MKTLHLTLFTCLALAVLSLGCSRGAPEGPEAKLSCSPENPDLCPVEIVPVEQTPEGEPPMEETASPTPPEGGPQVIVEPCFDNCETTPCDVVNEDGTCWDGNLVVSIPDPILEQKIQAALGEGEPITVSALSSLTSLDASNVVRESRDDEGIRDLTGLEYCESLVELSLINNLVSDLSPLSDLITLETLDLRVNEISDLSPLTELINIVELNLAGNLIRDLTPLLELLRNGGFADGGVVDLSYNPIANTSGNATVIKALTRAGVQVTTDGLTKEPVSPVTSPDGGGVTITPTIGGTKS